MGRLAVAVVVAFVACALALSHLARGGGRSTDSARHSNAGNTAAARAYTALRRRFAFSNGLYAGSDTRHSYAHVWPLSQALAASLAFGSLPGRGAASARADALRTIGALAHYRLGQGYNSVARPPLDRGGNLYYDDNNWIGLDLVAGYRMSGKRWMLRRAEGVFRFLVSGWDGNAGHACPGGVYWGRPPLRQIRTTVSTANATLVALRLYRATGKRTYLSWAQRMYDWVSSCLAAPNGLYYDHLDRHGTLSTREWTYNQGAMIAAGVLLARATGQRSYLNQAQATARAAHAYYRASRYKGEPPSYVAIYFGDLDILRRAVPTTWYRSDLRDYLRRHVALRVDGHFGSSPLYQAAASQLYSLAAAP